MTDADTQKDTKIVDSKSNDTNANEDSAKVRADQVQNISSSACELILVVVLFCFVFNKL